MRIFVLFLYFFQQLVAGVVVPGIPSGNIHPEGTFFITHHEQTPTYLQYIDQESEEGEEDEQADYSSSPTGSVSVYYPHWNAKQFLGADEFQFPVLENCTQQTDLYLLFENFRI